ncbi:hypothetical protein BU26DRAFT_203600 [Trematosphaeria pertusa]|uniref:Uncharacterized protein n=1 Tax=Trematosphaeria pertusa TaxID=390896 RepID=A0A6A6HS14_9PLEO|nr:uncharacterized protein BU26DRAFT_203600 [Trematosphaeria pertusa]KAF2240622.1 hypothetical protein BU26DRAFT_203600 [Trematosphaeria pertusa]
MSATIQTPLLSPPAVSPSAPTPRRRRPAARQSRTRDEDVIGHVLMNKKKFKCADSSCNDLTFGRLADLRRHHEQQHARNRVQYFCSYAGCPRSHAETGGKGRSFGTRKDKRDEHERNVHERNNSDQGYSLAESF